MHKTLFSSKRSRFSGVNTLSAATCLWILLGIKFFLNYLAWLAFLAAKKVQEEFFRPVTLQVKPDSVRFASQEVHCSWLVWECVDSLLSFATLWMFGCVWQIYAVWHIRDHVHANDYVSHCSLSSHRKWWEFGLGLGQDSHQEAKAGWRMGESTQTSKFIGTKNRVSGRAGVFAGF